MGGSAQVFTAGADDASDGAASAGLSVVALLLTLLYTWISVGAGVYNELLLKTGGSRSIHLANVPLYMWGVALNLLILLVQGSGDDDRGFWVGWDHMSTWVLMLLQSFIGLGVSVVMKRFDNVVKILCVAASNVVVYLFGVVVMGYDIEPSFALGGAMVMAAAYAYTKASSSSAGADTPRPSSPHSPSRSKLQP